MSDGERPEDKKSRISFLLILFALLGGAGYLNHGRMRPCCTDSDAWKIVVIFFICVAIAFFVSLYIRRANRRDS